jgi:hypothetical protein
MNKLSLIAAAALSAGVFGVAAIAQDSSETDFVKYDGNKDNLISWEEALGAYPTLSQILFDQADANDDGSLDEGEFTALQGLTAGLDGASSEVSSSEASSSAM